MELTLVDYDMVHYHHFKVAARSDQTRVGFGGRLSGLDLGVAQSELFASVFNFFPPLAKCFTK